ncbi:MAG: 2-C-methyl-D-erythritol 2,4-cyclodiphosphate synthase, partial [Clostridia bacterium]|nr:2-C-methyl-D-erythritol 2,4-cyclodiphosphate synthase [Clostridia bacterium]
MNFRIGHGYDVHRLVEGRDLILGGVKIEYEKGLLGHSDADVLCHAISDAILGACAERDIGFHFPDNDESIKGISSLIILAKCGEILASHGYAISNIDATVIAQKP